MISVFHNITVVVISMLTKSTRRIFATLWNENEITSGTGAGFLFIFNDCKDAGGRATHGAVAEARKQAHSKLCNCLRNAEDGQKD